MAQHRVLRVDSSLREVPEHGTHEFPIEIFLMQLSRMEDGFVDRHWHEELQLVYVTEGCVEFGIGQISERLEKGSGLFLNSRVLHQARPLSASESTYLCIDISPSLLLSFQGYLINRKYIEPYISDQKFSHFVFYGDREQHRPVIRTLLEMYRLNEERQYGYELAILIQIYTFWLELIRLQEKEYTSADLTDYESERLAVILDLIEKHYPEKLTLNDFSQAVHLSREACCRFFRKAAGTSIMNYLTDYRVRKSMYDLKNTDLSVSRIAMNNGFSTTGFYIRKFKDASGCTPQQFRKLQRPPAQVHARLNE